MLACVSGRSCEQLNLTIGSDFDTCDLCYTQDWESSAWLFGLLCGTAEHHENYGARAPRADDGLQVRRALFTCCVCLVARASVRIFDYVIRIIHVREHVT